MMAHHGAGTWDFSALWCQWRVCYWTVEHCGRLGETRSGNIPGLCRRRAGQPARVPAMRLVQVMVAALSAVMVAGLTGCSSTTSAPAITVFAAASLKPAFTEIGKRFETDHPGAAVQFNFAG